ncbi:MAG: metallophosphoesterase [Lachnospiraceae bacterium]|nr:metallophosphoesterase [Lachnospiraceae bacterium]
MLKIFLTGDNHFGKKYDRYPEVREKLTESRFECLKNMVEKAEKEECGLFVIAGDLFDHVSTVKVSDIERVVRILSEFSGRVFVLPGNHDFYNGDEKVWKSFEKACASVENNIILLNSYEKYCYEFGEERVEIYPAYCRSKHGRENNLGWIRDAKEEDTENIRIGIAHGAIVGVTPDMNQEYFPMTEQELFDIPMDVWLIGHTHIPYPADLKEEEETKGHRIFNAGTHEQTDLHNRTEGNAFILSVEKEDGKSQVFAKKYVSGKIRFYDLEIFVRPESDTALSDEIQRVLSEKIKNAGNAVIRLTIAGTARQEEYRQKEKIYQELFKGYLTYEVRDEELCEEITIEKIRSEYAETSFAAKFLEHFSGDATELSMAYELLRECREM